MNRIFAVVFLLTIAVYGFGAADAAGPCNMSFKNFSSLIIIPDTAQFTFATNPFYIEGCGDGWVHVKENERTRYGSSWGSSYNHYHLAYQRGVFCITSQGKAGIQSGGSCLAVNPSQEDRFVGSHSGDQWIRVYTYKSGTPEMTFSLKEIKVNKDSAGIKLYFKKTTGEWRYWSQLPPGWWNLSEASGIREILIRSVDATPYFFDDIVVTVP
jgi:hypothetical protein